MIRSFKDRETQLIWSGRRGRRLGQDMQGRALNKLKLLNRARTLDDLRNPRGTGCTR